MSKRDWDDAVPKTRRRKTPYADQSLGWLTSQYRQSADFRRLAPTTQKQYEYGFAKLHHLMKEDIAGLRRRHVLAIRDSLADTPAAANSVITVLSVLCGYAMDLEIIEVDPTARVKRFKLGEWRRWSDDELRTFYHETYEAMRRVIALAIYTGQRRSDLCKMTWGDVDGQGIRVVQQKTGHKLWITAHPRLAQHLAEWRQNTTTLTVLAHSDRQPWRPNILSTAFTQEAKRLGLPVQLHGLRKTAAAKLAEGGCTSRQIMAITGHSSLSEIERYTRQAEQKRLASDAISAYEPMPWEMVAKPLKRKG